MVPEVLNEIERREKEVSTLCSKLIRLRSDNPPGDVSEVAEFVAEYMRSRGLKVEIVEPERGRTNVIGVLEGKGDKKLLFNGHLDVVPPGNLDAWKYDPYEGRIVGGVIYGRGACDMKGAIASMLTFLDVIVKKEIRLGGDLIFHFVCDEETGGEFGTGYLAEKGYVKADGCIIGEGSGNSIMGYTLVVAERGVLWVRVKARGKAAHGSVPILGENAILKLVKAIESIQGLAKVEVKATPELEELASGSANYLASFIRAYGIEPETLKRNLLGITVNVGTIRGGTKVNVIPDYAEAEIDIRVPPSMTLEDARELLSERLEVAGPGVDVEAISASEPSYQDPKHPFVQFVRRCVEEITGRSAPLILMPWSTDARYIRRLGIPTIILGPLNESPHSANEYVPIRDLVMCAKMYALVAMRFLGVIAD